MIISVCMEFMKKLAKIIFVENFLFFYFYKKYFTQKSIFTEIQAKNYFGGHFWAWEELGGSLEEVTQRSRQISSLL